jgi:hypothetical protein
VYIYIYTQHSGRINIYSCSSYRVLVVITAVSNGSNRNSSFRDIALKILINIHVYV